MAGRVTVLVTALLVAVLGVVLVYVYTQRTVAEANGVLEPVEVLVASREIPEGTTVAEAAAAGLLESTERPRNALPTGALQDTADVLELETTATVLQGEILLRNRLVDPDESEQLGIRPQELAITIPLDDPNRVARFVQPDDLVAVFLTRQDVAAPDGSAGAGVATTQLLIPEVRVIAIGSQTAPEAEQTDDVSGALVTVSVGQKDAERLILAQSLGSLYLGKLTEGEGESAVTRSGGTTAGSLFEDTP